jgi:hypothetical protein
MAADPTTVPVDPSRAVELYLDARREELAKSTWRSQKCRLQKFANWCDDHEEIDVLSDLNGMLLHEWRIHLRDHHESEQVTKVVSDMFKLETKSNNE